MTDTSPIKRAQYYPALKKLSYYVTDRAKSTLWNLTLDQARAEIREYAIGPREIVQVLEIVPNNKI